MNGTCNAAATIENVIKPPRIILNPVMDMNKTILNPGLILKIEVSLVYMSMQLIGTFADVSVRCKIMNSYGIYREHTITRFSAFISAHGGRK
jgi:hypothetical protein